MKTAFALGKLNVDGCDCQLVRVALLASERGDAEPQGAARKLCPESSFLARAKAAKPS